MMACSVSKTIVTMNYIWNPSIRKFKNLVPPRLTRRIESKNLVHGLAYHSQNNDFKILRLVTYEVWAKAEVYTLTSDSWREVVMPVESITRFIGGYSYKSYCISFHGALHTIVARFYGRCFHYVL